MEFRGLVLEPMAPPKKTKNKKQTKKQTNKKMHPFTML